ncbi:hypothetical protein CPT_Sonora_085 [Stenotrophomonas phage Sonora]|nr:hypothetical protein CPT_Sonora_085 [Stenotrophomonas phage Sonora]
MRPKPRKFTVDWYSEKDGPLPGDFVRHRNPSGKLIGFYKILQVRQVQVRVSRGEVARYVLSMERIEPRQLDGRILDVWNHPHTPKPKVPDRFSPLL